jgi:hypothetical protein
MAFDVLGSLDKAASLSQVEVRKIVERALREMLAGFELEGIEEAIRAQDAQPIIRAAKAWSNLAEAIASAFEPDAMLRRTFVAAAHGAAREGVTWASVKLAPMEDRAVAYLEERGAELVSEVTATTQKAIRRLVGQTFKGPEDFRDVARELLRRKEFGLSRPLQAEHLKFVRDLKAQGDLTAREVAMRSGKKFQDLRRKRAGLVAHTEAYNAGNQGRIELYREAADQDVIDPDVYLLQWITRGFNVCPRCKAMDLKTTGIMSGKFKSDKVVGGKFDGKTATAARPTLHPKCFCGIRSIRADDA